VFTFGASLKITEVAQLFGLLFSTLKVKQVLILTKITWATFWAFFSKTYLVTLVTRTTMFRHHPKSFQT
jgi:hypothetical protein